jgi:hypothetical protein
VMAEALYAGWAVRPVRRNELRAAPPVDPPLGMRAFLRFYLPLMVTPSINFLAMPLSAAAMSRMPYALESLAIWPALGGITFTFRSLGFAFNEVVVSQLDAHRPVPALRRFATLLSLAASGLLSLLALGPLGRAWFEHVSGLEPPLATLAAAAFPLMALAPALSVWQSYWQGALVHSRRTHGVTQSMVALLLATLAVLGAGIAWNGPAGIHFAAGALLAGNAGRVAVVARAPRDRARRRARRRLTRCPGRADRCRGQ